MRKRVNGLNTKQLQQMDEIIDRTKKVAEQARVDRVEGKLARRNLNVGEQGKKLRADAD